MESIVKHHPGSFTYSRQFLRAWRAELEWRERAERGRLRRKEVRS
jgi:hypothetical protein